MSAEDDLAKILAALETRGASVVQVGGNSRRYTNDPSDGSPFSIQARRLIDHHADLVKNYDLVTGMLVQIKPGLEGHLKIPGPGQPCIVTRVFDKPLLDSRAENGNPDFGREFHITAMTLIDGRAVEFAYDKRFFQPYTGEIA